MHQILTENLEKCLEGRLSGPLQASLDTHLANCSTCRNTLDEAREAGRLLRLLRIAEDDEPAPEPAPGFYVNLRESIAEVPMTGTWWWMLHPAFRQIALAAAIVVAMLGGYYATLHATEIGSSTAAELLLDMPVEHDAPALLVAAQPPSQKGSAGLCLRCWRQKSAASALDQHERREMVMAAVVAQVGD